MTHPRPARRCSRSRAALLATAAALTLTALLAPVLPTPTSPAPLASATAASCPASAGKVLRATPATYAKTVSLTFDDGPSKFTPQILDVLAAKGVRATFFVTGQDVRADPAMTRRIVAEGHVLANHTWSHPQALPGSTPYGRFDDLPTSVKRSQLDTTTAEIKKVTGVTPCFFRGPGGWHHSASTAAETKARGLTIAHWTLDSEDSGQARTTTTASTNTIISRATEYHAHPIVLFHDGKASPEPESLVTSNRSNTVAALPKVIDHYKRHGYVFTDPAGRKLATGTPKPSAPPAPKPVLPPPAGWSAVVPLEVDGSTGSEVVTYDSTTGRFAVLDAYAGATTELAAGTWSRGWTHVVPVELDRTAGSELLVYDAATGRVVFLDITPSGGVRTLGTGNWNPGWSQIVPVEVDGSAGSELVTYNGATGRALFLDLTATGGGRTISTATWSKGWSQIVPVEVDGSAGSELVTYNGATGTVLFLDTTAAGRIRTLSQTTWTKGWTHIAPAEIDGSAGNELVVYNGATGTVLFGDATATGRLRTMAQGQWSKGWTQVAALETDRTAGSELLTYNRSTGSRLLLDVSSQAAIRTLGSATWPRG